MRLRAPAVLHDQILVVREQGEAAVFLGSHVKVAGERGGGAGGQRRQVEALRAGQADVGLRRAGEGRQVDAAGDDGGAGLVAQ